VRYLLLSDIHANLHALDAVLADAGAIGYDAVLVLGDLVGYGGDPGPSIDRTLSLAPAAIIRGNHDKVCAGLEPSTDFNDIARRSIEWTMGVLSPDALRALAALPRGPQTVGERVEISHGAPFDEDFYIFDADDASRAIEAASARWSFVGHTHVPALYATHDDPIRALARDDGQGPARADVFALPARGPALVNVGSVGQPRDGDPRAAYGLLDPDTGTLTLRRVPYDIAAAQARIVDAGLPPYLALRLGRGQ
jgi:diadenosine tetraphosphatase ApaH/serine/threonine PP2A family protein phosphatase